MNPPAPSAKLCTSRAADSTSLTSIFNAPVIASIGSDEVSDRSAAAEREAAAGAMVPESLATSIGGGALWWPQAAAATPITTRIGASFVFMPASRGNGRERWVGQQKRPEVPS